MAFNCEVTADLAREIREFRSPTDGETRMFYEIVIAPSYTEEGLAVRPARSTGNHSSSTEILQTAPTVYRSLY